MRDFTFSQYTNLLKALLRQGFTFLTFAKYLEQTTKNKSIILRHDVDKLPINSHIIAKIENQLGICGSYYFRIGKESFNPEIIGQTKELGHEVGYHYEDFVFARQKAKGKRQKDENSEDYEKYLAGIAIESFKENLEKLRKIVPVKTICMHGSPMSRWDSRLLWKYYDYRDFGIVGEPYFDVNFDEIFYLTDTGRRWDGGGVSVRDKAEGGRQKAGGIDPFVDWAVKPKQGSLSNMTERGIEFQSSYNFRSTNEIIRAVENGELPDKIMMTFHPQRWTDRMGPWVKELVWQNVKNVGKWGLVKIRQRTGRGR